MDPFSICVDHENVKEEMLIKSLQKDFAFRWKNLPLQQSDSILRQEALKKLIFQFVQELYFGKQEFEKLIENQVLKIDNLYIQANDESYFDE
ncbi:hypothetical protein BWD12_15095 [Leptospira santarosai serovar Bananal]|uniref:Uncharacterized protein n=1 Tax=Leptospira santarosai TaxID=28183 RepID=A0AB73LKC4_9LEPT|nr:hypothetical protein [Leptospira santarosai]OLY65168.1 hypothetical protein BWD11_04485 [Leptospira santarosai serovar Grippotyphosa]ONF77696.1 hypothetical protein BWD12_15095 [Leptospira santarosai serovar Bananal]ONF90210.1 hypothetical protein BWD14_19690 [Leptospira santarosai]